MTFNERLSLFSASDLVAIGFLFAGWILIGWRIENQSAARASVSVLMNDYRRLWMTQMVTRQPRIFDSQVLGLMRQGTAFFASASMIAIGGGLALIGNPTQLRGVASDLRLGSAPDLVWEIKLILILFFLAHAFLKFVWAHRLFGYCAILMAAVPNDPDDALAQPRAAQVAEVSITAARSFNKAMRALYFALATAAWLLGPLALIVAVAATLAMLYRREFASQSRAVLLQDPAAPEPHTDVTAAPGGPL